MIILSDRRAIAVAFFIGWELASSAAEQTGTLAVSDPAEGQGTGLTADQSSFAKPSWLTDLSLEVKESYDDNLYLSGVNPKYLPASYLVPPGSGAALQDQSSLVTTVAPRIAVNFAPLLADQQIFQALSLAYAPEFVVFHEAPAENYDAHSFPATVRADWDAFSLSANNTFNFIAGSSYGPTYPGALLNAYSTCAPRKRREQINDQGTYSLQYDHNNWFVRPTASLLAYDMMTKLFDVTGYQNYASRYDVNGGADFGYRIEPQLAATLGYRYGHQYQEQFSFSRYSSSSDYQRVLLGLEGKPWEWLEVKIQGGPDFRSYDPDTATHITPVNDKNMVTYYGEANLTATLTAKDALTFTYKQFQWVSQLGSVPYFDSTYQLGYHRKLSDHLALDLGGSVLSSDYTSGNLASCKRLDLEYVVSARLGYTFNARVSANLAYEFDAGRNGLSGVVNPETRGFDRNLISIGVLVKF
jgi:hypothetical protein